MNTLLPKSLPLLVVASLLNPGLLYPGLARAQDNMPPAMPPMQVPGTMPSMAPSMNPAITPALTPALTPATAKKAKVSWFAFDDALARAISAQQAAYYEKVQASATQNRQALDAMGLAQSRVAANLARLQGNQASQASVDSQPYETITVYRMLDDALNEIAARLTPINRPSATASTGAAMDTQLAAAHQARASQLIMREAMPVYWQAMAGSQVKLPAMRLQRRLEQLLEPYTLAREPEDLALRDALLFQLESVKQLLNQADQQRQQLADLLAMDEKQALRLRFNPNTSMPIPLLEPAGNLSQRALAMNPAKAALGIDDTNKYLRSLSPKLVATLDDSQSMPSTSLATSLTNSGHKQAWLSAGKILAFDLFLVLDGFERQQWLRRKAEQQPALEHQLASAALARMHLANELYQQSLEQFALADCQAANGRQLRTLDDLRLDNSVTQQLQAISGQLRQLENEKQRLAAYGQLLQDFSRLVDAVTPNTLPANLAGQPLSVQRNQVQQQLRLSRKDAGPGQYDCFRSAEQIRQQRLAVEQEIEQRRQAELELAKMEAAKQAAAKKKMQTAPYKGNQWLARQNPRAFVLQLQSSGNANKLEQYARKHRLGLGKQAHIISSTYQGKPLYTLLYGLFGDRELAFVGQFKLPEKVQVENRIVTRRIAELQSLPKAVKRN